MIAAVEGLICAYPYEVLPDRWVNVIVYSCQVAQPQTPLISDEHDRAAFLKLDNLVELMIADGYRHAITQWFASR